MQHRIIVGLAAEDVKAVLVGRPEAVPGYGVTEATAIADLIGQNADIFRIEIRLGNPLGPEPTWSTLKKWSPGVGGGGDGY